MHNINGAKIKKIYFYVEYVKIYFGIFCILSCLMESKLHQLSGSAFIFFFVKKHLQQVIKLALQLISAAELGDIQSFVVSGV